MKKIILLNFVIALMIVIVSGISFTTGAVVINSKISQSQDIEIFGMGTIKGTIINQNGNPVAFVRVMAVGNPRDNTTKLGVTYTHLLFGGKGKYSLEVPAGRYLFVRAARLPLYRGAWAGPIVVTEGGSVTLDLSITYVGPENNPVVISCSRILDYKSLVYMLYSRLILN